MHPTVFNAFDEICGRLDVLGNVLEIGASPHHQTLLALPSLSGAAQRIGVGLDGESQGDGYTIRHTNSHDGTTHLAAQLGVPTIAIMSGDVDIEVWRPIGPRTIVLRSDVACAPCNLNTLSRCPVGHVCMTTIMPATVLEAADELLSTGGQDAVRPSRA